MKRWLPEPRKRISVGLDEEQTRLLWRPAEEIKMWMDAHNIREKEEGISTVSIFSMKWKIVIYRLWKS